jgi:hypothetical protein
LADAAYLTAFQAAMNELQAEVIAVPPFDIRYLQAGLAVHFRCQHPEALHMRVDIMSRMRGVADFEELWQRRTSAELPDGTPVELLSLSDLVQAKKTQRDKDWPMIARLVENHYLAIQQRTAPTSDQIEFWLRELRSAAKLLEVAEQYPGAAAQIATRRPAVESAVAGDEEETSLRLKAEEEFERAADRAYWQPLRALLEELRQNRERG